MRILKYISLSTFFVLTGCVSLAPDYQRPDLPVPQQFSRAQNGLVSAGDYSVPGWRQFFANPAATALIEQTLRTNADLKMAILNVREAREKYGVTRADQLPQVNGNLSATSQGGFTGEKRTEDSYETGFSLSFEPDFWGRLQNLSDADQQNFLATQEAQRTAQILLISTTLQSYYQYHLATEQLAISRESLSYYVQSYRFIERRLVTGNSNVLALEQARGQTESAQADIAAREGELKQAANVLQRISGDYRPLLPADPADVLVSPEVNLPANIRSDILLQRPDIAEAEHLLLAANANIGAARAAFFPSVSLTGDISGSSSNLASVLDAATGIWRFIPKITIPLFNGGRNKANLALAEIRREKAVVIYEQRIQNAFKEVADALVLRDSLAQQIAAQTRYAASLDITLQRAQFLFARGQISYLDVLDAQRALLTTRQTLATLKYNQKINEITLFAALGGGWKA